MENENDRPLCYCGKPVEILSNGVLYDLCPDCAREEFLAEQRAARAGCFGPGNDL